MRVLTDDDVRRSLSAADAVAWMREAVLAHAAGELLAPPRVSAHVGDGRIVLTAGAGPGWYGYRAYDTFGLPGGEQVVAVHDGETGRVSAIAVGSALGQRRTSALGGVAHDALAGRGPLTVAVIGSGRQALGQHWALRAVREVGHTSVYSRDPEHRDAAVEELRAEHERPVLPAGSAQEAVEGADVVLLATTSSTPVIRTAWLGPDTYVAALGPKALGGAEYDDDLLDTASVVTSDSVEQLRDLTPSALTPAVDAALRPLADLVATAPPASGRRVYLSVGLAGTEPYLLRRLVASLD